jgi:hypothetical protein
LIAHPNRNAPRRAAEKSLAGAQFGPRQRPSRFSASYDVLRDGQRIVSATAHGGDAKLVVIVNWFTEVRR